MNPIIFAMRHPITVMVTIFGVVLGAGMALWRMPIDIFPDLNTPVIYVAQPYGGMDPEQMEGFLSNYYEYHFLYITGIDHVESKNIQSLALMKLVFHPGTNMANAMAETVNYISPSGNVPIGGKAPMVPVNSVVKNPKELGKIVIRPGSNPTVEVRDIGWVE